MKDNNKNIGNIWQLIEIIEHQKKRLQNLPPTMKAKKNFGMIQQLIQIMET